MMRFAELAAQYPLSGGAYQWSKLVGSPFLGWMVGWIYLACLIVTLAAVALALQSAAPPKPVLEEYWPDIEGLAHRDRVTEESMQAGSFFDAAPVHLLTTATIDQLREFLRQAGELAHFVRIEQLIVIASPIQTPAACNGQ